MTETPQVSPDPQAAARSTRKTALTCVAIIGGMLGVAYASVPLYRLFCQVTGYGGTPRIAEEAIAPGVGEGQIARDVVVQFDANINRALPWDFKPVQRQVTIPMGDQGLAFYYAENTSDRPIVGTATFNVTPLKAASYFTKIDCFCFTEQRLLPGESMDMPVTFFIDPEMATDPDTAEITTITLSYTFFEDLDVETDFDAQDAAALPEGSGDVSTTAHPTSETDAAERHAPLTPTSITGTTGPVRFQGDIDS